MAIAFDVLSTGGTAGTSLSFSHTCTGSNLILIVGIEVASGSDLVSGITFNGSAMTLIGKQVMAASRYAYLYYLIAPSVGTFNVVISLSSSATVQAAAASYTGVLQSTQPDASTTNLVSSATSATTALITVADNCWMISYCQCRLVGAPTAGTNITNRGSSGSDGLGDSNGIIHPAGSFSMTWTQSGLEDFNIIQASIKPAAGTVYTKSFTETITISDTFAKLIGLKLTDTETISDSITKFFTILFSETTTVSDSLTKLTARSFSDSMTMSDSLVKLVGKLLTDTMTLSEVVVKAITRTFVDSMTIVDTLTKFVAGIWTKAPIASVAKFFNVFGSSASSSSPSANSSTKGPKGS